jgi:hypothetical protein
VICRARRLVGRAATLILRVCRRLRVFPFSLGYIVVSAGVRWRGLAGSERLARVGEAKAVASPLAVLIWLDRISRETPGAAFDACLRLSIDAPDDHLHDIFSILLASPRLQSLALYWDEERLVEDLPLFQARRDRARASVWFTVREDLRAPGPQALRDFFAAHHETIDLPVAARREARTLIKRLAGGAWTACLNLPDGARWLAGALAAALPDAAFFDMRSFDNASVRHNLYAVGGWGLTEHERLALAVDGDAYVGRFDELAAATVIAGKPAALVSGETFGPGEALAGRDECIWISNLSNQSEVTAVVLEFLGRRRAHLRA